MPSKNTTSAVNDAEAMITTRIILSIMPPTYSIDVTLLNPEPSTLIVQMYSPSASSAYSLRNTICFPFQENAKYEFSEYYTASTNTNVLPKVGSYVSLSSLTNHYYYNRTYGVDDISYGAIFNGSSDIYFEHNDENEGGRFAMVTGIGEANNSLFMCAMSNSRDDSPYELYSTEWLRMSHTYNLIGRPITK